MSLSLYFNVSGDAGTLCNYGGWELLGEWVDTIDLSRCEALDYLCTYNCVGVLHRLADEVKTLLTEEKTMPKAVRSILTKLGKMLAERSPEDERADVTDGVEDEDEDEGDD